MRHTSRGFWAAAASMLAVLTAVAMLAGCAERRPPIDRIQANAVKKEVFVGERAADGTYPQRPEYFYQSTVVDIPGAYFEGGNLSIIVVGATGFDGVERVRFDIQEDWLYARRSFEYVGGAERNPDPTRDPNYMGAILAAYPILSHFDIKRAYNPTTGEELNIIEENTTDRPWYEREHMRVDWSTNYAKNFKFMGQDIPQDPVPYYVQDKNDPDFPVISHDYIDITNVMTVSPEWMTFADGQSYPTCFIFYHQTADCATQPIKVRNSFFRVQERNYEPLDMFNYKSEWFAFFTTDRLNYVNPIDVTQKSHQRRAQRHHIWKKDFELAADGTKTPIPMAEREPRPIVYFLNQWPQDIVEPTRFAASEWNKTFRRVVAAAKNPSAPDPDAQNVPDMWVLCENSPVLETDHQACQDKVMEVWSKVACPDGSPDGQICYHDLPPGQTPVQKQAELEAIDKNANLNDTEKAQAKKEYSRKRTIRLGDVRFNFLAWVPKWYDGFKLLGFGPTNTDPLSGESVSATAYIYVHNEYSAINVQEMVQLLNGDMKPDEYIEGVNLENWIKQVSWKGDGRMVSQDEVRSMYRAMDTKWMQDTPSPHRGKMATILGEDEYLTSKQFLRQGLSYMRDQLGVLSADRNGSGARLASIAGSPIEEMMMNDEIKMAAGYAPGTKFTQEMMQRSSPARGGFMNTLKVIAETRKRLGAAGYDFAEMAEPPLMALAAQMKGRGIKDVWATARDLILRAVTIHELGHNMGLYHNFAGSEDFMNFGEQYHQLRTANGTHAPGPRWTDPLRPEELDDGKGGSIYDHAYSSVMDYEGIYTLDGHGIGRYDQAAMLFGYANLVEVYKDLGSRPSTTRSRLEEWLSSKGSPLLFYSSGPTSFHYTQWYKDTWMGNLFWQQSNREIVSADQIAKDGISVCLTTPCDDNAEIDENRARVPYISCTDYQADVSDGCLRRDYGVDQYERMWQHVNGLDLWYPTRNFIRGRYGIDPEYYIGRYYERNFERFKSFNDYFALIASFLNQFYTPQQVEDFMSDPLMGWGGYTIAIHDAFNQIGKTLSMQDMTSYTTTKLPDGMEVWAEDPFGRGPSLGVERARAFTTTWWPISNYQDNCGVFFWDCLHHIGFYYDKIMAIYAMSNPETYFVARDTSEDIRQWRISFFDNFGSQIKRMFGGILSQEYGDFANYATPSMQKIYYRDYANPANDFIPEGETKGSGVPPAGGLPIYPYTGFTVQLYAAVLGMARFANNFDHSFMDESRVYRVGSGNTTTPPAGYTVAMYIDPVTNMAYGTTEWPPPKQYMSIAQRVIRRANLLKGRTVYCNHDDPEAQDACAPDWETLTDDQKKAAAAELRIYKDLLDIMVDLTGRYDAAGRCYGDPYNPGDIQCWDY